MKVQLTPAPPSDRPTLDNLMQLYIHDFSEHWSGRREGELLEDGRFAAYPLDPYWREANYLPFLIRVNGQLGGFALLNNLSHAGQNVDRNVAEFFIVRKHRRGGVGTLAAQQLFSRFPGQWETAVARRNVAALAFWRRAIGQHPLATQIEELDVTSSVWNGPIIRFRIRAPN